MWYDKAKLPSGIKEIELHLENIDDVPLRVSSFFDSSPNSIQEMLRIMEDYGEKSFSLGSALSLDNNAIFKQTYVSCGVVGKYSSSFEKAAAFLCCYSSDLILLSNHPKLIVELVTTSKVLLRNCYQVLFSLFVVNTTLIITFALTTVLRIPHPIQTVLSFWYNVQFLPYYIVILFYSSKDEVLNEMPSKNDEDGEKLYQAKWKRFRKQILAQSLFSAFIISFLSYYVQCHGLNCALWKTSSSIYIEEENTLILIHFLTTWLVLFSTLPFCRPTPIYKCFLSMKHIILVASVILFIQFLICTTWNGYLSLSWISENVAEFVIAVVLASLLLVSGEWLKARERKLRRAENSRLRLLYETKLGMFSPK